MLELLHTWRTWRYWRTRGYSARTALHLARNTLPHAPSKPRRKRGFFLARFPTFWTKP